MADGLSLEISLKDLGAADLLDRALARSMNLRPAFRQIGERLVASTHRRFQSGTGPNGIPWSPLKDKTLQAKASGGYSSMILQRTGRLMNSIHPVVGKDYVKISTNVHADNGYLYPLVHQMGSSDGTIPKREFLAVDRSDMAAIQKILGAYLGDL